MLQELKNVMIVLLRVLNSVGLGSCEFGILLGTFQSHVICCGNWVLVRPDLTTHLVCDLQFYYISRKHICNVMRMLHAYLKEMINRIALKGKVCIWCEVEICPFIHNSLRLVMIATGSLLCPPTSGRQPLRSRCTSFDVACD